MTMATAAAPAVALPPIDFARASTKKTNPFTVFNFSSGAEQVEQLNSQGYMEKINLVGGFTITETTMATPGADNPWALLRRIRLTDSQGGVIYSCTGYNSFLHSKFLMGHRNWIDGSTDTSIFVGTAFDDAIVPTLLWEIPVANNERDLIGLMPNQSDAFKYQLALQWATYAQLATTPGDMTIVGAVNPYYSYFTIPTPVAPSGAPQQTTPPFYGVVHQVVDTTQSFGTAPGVNQRYPLQVGQVYRGLILVVRDAGVRENGLTAVRFKYGDDVTLFSMSGQDLRSENFLRNGRDLPTGVYVIDFMSDSGLRPGLDYRRQYVDTRQMAQAWLELDFTGIAGAGTVDVVKDVFIAPNGVTF